MVISRANDRIHMVRACKCSDMLWPEKLSIRRKLAPFGMLALFVLWQLFAFGFRRQDLPVYVGTIGVLAVLERLSFKYPRSTPEPKSAIDWLAENLVEPV